MSTVLGKESACSRFWGLEEQAHSKAAAPYRAELGIRAFLKAMAPRFLERLRKGDARDQQEPAVTAGAPKKAHWWQHARGKKEPLAEQQQQHRGRGGGREPIDSDAAPGPGAPGSQRFVAEGPSSSSSRPGEHEEASRERQAAGARSGSRVAIADDVAATNLSLGNSAAHAPPPSRPQQQQQQQQQQRRSSAEDRSRSDGGSSGSRDAMPSLDSVLPSSSGGGAAAGGGGGGGGGAGSSSSATPAASGRSSAAAAAGAAACSAPPPPQPQQPAPTLSKPPLPPTAAEQLLASSKQSRSFPSSSSSQQQQQQQLQQQKGGPCSPPPPCSSSSSSSAPQHPPLVATLKEVAPAAHPQRPTKLTGMAAFDVADRSSFDVAGSAAFGSPAPPERAAEGEKGGDGSDDDAAAAAPSAAATTTTTTTTPRPAPPPPAPLRSSLDAPVSQRQSIESAGSGAGRSGGGAGHAGGGYSSGGGASVASSAARSARSSFALEAADRPAAAARGTSPPPPPQVPSSGQGVGGGGSEEFYPQAGVVSSVIDKGASSAAADADAATAWLPPLEASAAFLPSLPSHLVLRASSLALVPPDTPLPASLLWRLWGLQRKEKEKKEEIEGVAAEKGEEEEDEEHALAAAATAIADELASPEAGAVMKVARLADGSAWALTSPHVHAALVQARLGGPAGEHRELLSAYCRRSGSSGSAGESQKTPFSVSASSLLPTSSPTEASAAASLLALAPDDGYLMHNVGHHLAAAGALPALAALLGDAAWLDAKLRSYGAAAVTADFRRALALAQQEVEVAVQKQQRQRARGGGGEEEEGNVGDADFASAASPQPAAACLVSTAERIRLLLAAFQMSAPAAVACPAARGVLGAQMASRLLAAERALCPHLSAERAPSALSPKLLLLSSPSQAAAAERDGDGEEGEEIGEDLLPPARGLRTTTPSLQQAGGAARLVLRGHTSPVLRVLIAPNGVDVVAVAADGAVRVFDLEVGDCVLHVPAISLAPLPSSSSSASASGKIATTASYSSLSSAFPLPSAAAAAAAAAAVASAAAASSPAAFAVTPAAAAATNPRLRDGNAVEDASLDGSGRLLLTACADGVARVWDLAAATTATTAASTSSASACLVR